MYHLPHQPHPFSEKGRPAHAKLVTGLQVDDMSLLQHPLVQFNSIALKERTQ